MKNIYSVYFCDDMGNALSPVLDNPFVPGTGDIAFLGSEDRPNEPPRRYMVVTREFVVVPQRGGAGWSVQVAVIVGECPQVCPHCYEKSATSAPIVHGDGCKGKKRTP